MLPRYKPEWQEDDGLELLIGHIGPLDIYYEPETNAHGEWILVVGPPERKNRDTPYNFDVYEIGHNPPALTESQWSSLDIHVELSEMCEIYQLAVERGLLKE